MKRFFQIVIFLLLLSSLVMLSGCNTQEQIEAEIAAKEDKTDIPCEDNVSIPGVIKYSDLKCTVKHYVSGGTWEVDFSGILENLTDYPINDNYRVNIRVYDSNNVILDEDYYYIGSMPANAKENSHHAFISHSDTKPARIVLGSTNEKNK